MLCLKLCRILLCSFGKFLLRAYYVPGLRGQQEADRQRPQPACFQMSDGRSGYPGQCNKEAKGTGQRELPPWGKNVKRNGNRKGVFVGRGGGGALRPPADALRRIRRSRSGGGEPGGSVSVLVTTPSPFYKEARYQHQAPTMCFGRTYYVPLYMCISYHSSTPPSISGQSPHFTQGETGWGRSTHWSEVTKPASVRPGVCP